MGLLAAPFLAKGSGATAGVGFLTLGLSALRLLHAGDGNSGAARSAVTSGTILPGSLAHFVRLAPVDGLHPQRRPITVAGPWPNFTAFPFPRPAQIFIRSLSAAARAVKSSRGALSGHGFNRAETAAKSSRLQPLRFCFSPNFYPLRLCPSPCRCVKTRSGGASSTLQRIASIHQRPSIRIVE